MAKRALRRECAINADRYRLHFLSDASIEASNFAPVLVEADATMCDEECIEECHEIVTVLIWSRPSCATGATPREVYLF